MSTRRLLLPIVSHVSNEIANKTSTSGDTNTNLVSRKGTNWNATRGQPSLTLLPPGDNVQKFLVLRAHRLVIIVTIGMGSVEVAGSSVSLAAS